MERQQRPSQKHKVRSQTLVLGSSLPPWHGEIQVTWEGGEKIPDLGEAVQRHRSVNPGKFRMAGIQRKSVMG